MRKEKMNTDVKLRIATIEDLDVLVNHHVAMFKEIMEIESKQVEDIAYNAMAKSYKLKLSDQLPISTCKAWIVFEDNGNHNPIASAAMSILKMVPTPFDSSYEIGYLHSIYTEKKWRRQGYAEALIRAAIQNAAENGINRIDLAASSEGKPLYDKFGFQEMKSIMRLHIKDREG
jgi:ribosomal protein S18 acetylase RimI-like enzyme